MRSSLVGGSLFGFIERHDFFSINDGVVKWDRRLPAHFCGLADDEGSRTTREENAPKSDQSVRLNASRLSLRRFLCELPFAAEHRL
jgi:hypothetical protein